MGSPVATSIWTLKQYTQVLKYLPNNSKWGIDVNGQHIICNWSEASTWKNNKKKKPTHQLLTRYFEIRLIAMDNLEIPWNVKQKQQIHKYYDDDKTRNMCDMYS